jgi:hypothetical protein
LRVAALRRSSREIVEAARPRRRAISQTPHFCECRIAISSRSANDGGLENRGEADAGRIFDVVFHVKHSRKQGGRGAIGKREVCGAGMYDRLILA